VSRKDAKPTQMDCARIAAGDILAGRVPFKQHLKSLAKQFFMDRELIRELKCITIQRVMKGEGNDRPC
jgi:hypothetical protein